MNNWSFQRSHSLLDQNVVHLVMYGAQVEPDGSFVEGLVTLETVFSVIEGLVVLFQIPQQVALHHVLHQLRERLQLLGDRSVTSTAK